SQMRGDFSKHISELRDQLVEIASLLELELDFSEEDVEFASRSHLKNLAELLLAKISTLVSSFSTGSALKDGVPVAIIGEPNAGKSTLLNVLLADNRAIVSDIPGTTRDTIEDTMEIDGVLYRFIDTAGIRETTDAVENLGIERSYSAISKARIVIWLVTPDMSPERFIDFRKSISTHLTDGAKLIIAVNKIDTLVATDGHNSSPAENGNGLIDEKHINDNSAYKISNEDFSNVNALLAKFAESIDSTETPLLHISASTGQNIPTLLNQLYKYSGADESENADLIVTNARHYEALTHAKSSLIRVIDGINTNLSGDFIAQDLRETIHHLSSITGSITTEDLLKTIFEKFCIGK
ncbi:MAG: GTP-binding protein, partial [Duncaniella sp.]|nr:GTP-binding protein [Duncaniella sp.]